MTGKQSHGTATRGGFVHKVTEAELAAFCDDQLQRYEAYRKRMGFTSDIHDYQFYAECGPKYARIVSERNTKREREHYDDYRDRRVVCFVNLTNGDIHKAAGWKAPVTVGKTKGVRGNIYDGQRGASCMNEYGTVYLK